MLASGVGEKGATRVPRRLELECVVRQGWSGSEGPGLSHRVSGEPQKSESHGGGHTGTRQRVTGRHSPGESPSSQTEDRDRLWADPTGRVPERVHGGTNTALVGPNK